MGKRIWIVNYYTGTPETQSNPRYTQFARRFMEVGYDVVTFNSSLTAHTQEEQTANKQLFLCRDYGDFKFVHVNAPVYKGNGIARMRSIFMFALSILMHCKKFDRPDVILHNIHTPFDYPIVWTAKKLKAKYIAEAWDLWPEDFVTFGLVSRKNPALQFFYWIEKKLYYHADKIVFTFLGAFDYLKNKGWTKETGGKIDMSNVHYINNGIDLDAFDKDKITYPRLDSDLNDSSTIKIIYLGSINRANHVNTLIDAAKNLINSSKYKFFIYGDGSDREYLEKKVLNEGIKNVIFKEKRILLCEVAWVVSQATINVMNYEKGFGAYGVSSGKMFQYLAAGKPIVCNVNIAYDDVITDNNLGIAKDLDTPESFAKAIRELAELPTEEYKAMCERVRETAKRFDYKVLTAEEIKVIESCFE